MKRDIDVTIRYVIFDANKVKITSKNLFIDNF